MGGKKKNINKSFEIYILNYFYFFIILLIFFFQVKGGMIRDDKNFNNKDFNTS